MDQRLLYKRNSHGIRIKKRCASCRFKDINHYGTRMCTKSLQKVKPDFKCNMWRMADAFKNAGLPLGVVKDKVSKEIIIN